MWRNYVRKHLTCFNFFLEKPSVQLLVLLRYSIQIVPLKSPINRNHQSPPKKPNLTTIHNIPFTVWETRQPQCHFYVELPRTIHPAY